MSIHALNWAFDQAVASSSCKFILVCMANYANESFEAYPSITTICRMTSLDRKTVITGLARLVERGLISDTGRRVGATRTIPVYKFNSPKSGTIPKTEQSQNSVEAVPNFPISSPVFPQKQSQKRDTEPSGNHQGTINEPKSARARLYGIPSSPEEVVAYGATLNPVVIPATCQDFFAHYEGQARTNANGEVFWITSGEAVVTNWKAKLPSFHGNGGTNGKGRPATITELKAIIQVKEEKAKALRDRYASEGPMAVEWNNQSKRTEWSALRSEIKGLKERIEKMA